MKKTNIIQKYIKIVVKYILNKFTTHTKKSSALINLMKFMCFPIFEILNKAISFFISILYAFCSVVIDFIIKLIYRLLVIFCSILNFKITISFKTILKNIIKLFKRF